MAYKAATYLSKFCSDAGASSVMTPYQHLVTNFIPRVVQADRSAMTSVGRGDFGPIKNAMVVPSLSDTLISVSAFDLIGHYTVYGDKKVTVYDGDPTKPSSKVLARGYLAANKLY